MPKIVIREVDETSAHNYYFVDGFLDNFGIEIVRNNDYINFFMLKDQSFYDVYTDMMNEITVSEGYVSQYLGDQINYFITRVLGNDI